ncbi:MAG: glycosyltransferase, partial [Planctomycetota bacterium]
LLDLLDDIRNAAPEAHLEIYGDGPCRKSLQQKVRSLRLEERVHFHGHVGHEELDQSLGTSSLFLLHSTHTAERLPNVIKEALASGCFCITTSSPDIRELIQDESMGLVLEPGDLDSWRRAVLAHLAQQPLECSRPEIDKRRKLPQVFDVSSAADALIEFWNFQEPPAVEEIHRSADPIVDASA